MNIQNEPSEISSRTTAPRAVPVLLALLAAVLACCCGQPEPPLATGAETGQGQEPTEGLGYLDELAALGYVDFAGENDNAGASGVTRWTRGATWAGVNLVTSLPNSSASLVGMDGEVLHTWRDQDGIDTRWTRVELLENGDIICISPKENYLVRMAWNGEVIWRKAMDAHHDIRVRPDGNLLVLTRNLRRIPEIHRRRLSVDNSLTVLGVDGQRISEHSLWDILSTEPALSIQAPEGIDDAPASLNVDPIHCNTAVPMASAELAQKNEIFALDNVLVTLRYPCAIAIVHPESERVVWHWGEGELEGPHEASVMANGHILILDNGWDARGYSRVVEMDPTNGKIVWEYVAPVPADFFTSGRGTAQALPNGNVLIGDSNSGEAFEVTRAGEVVWRYLNPNVDPAGKRAVLRIKRFDQDTVAGIRQRGESR